MKLICNVVISVLTLVLLLSCSNNTNNTKKTFFKVNASKAIQTNDGINLDEASMILEMYRVLSIGRLTMYYSELVDEKLNWKSKEKGHWGYTVMKNPVLINKKNGDLQHGDTRYSLKELIKRYKVNEKQYLKRLQSRNNS